MSYEIFLIHKLEERIAKKAAHYKKYLEIDFPDRPSDIDYLNTYIKGELFNEFSRSILDYIKPMNGRDSYRTLSLTDNQYQTHSYCLECSRHLFLSNYHKNYLTPSYVIFNLDAYQTGFANDVWNVYTEHFHLFKELISQLLYNLKNGLLGACPSFITEEVQHTTKIKNRDFNSFISHLVSYVPYTGTTLNFKLMLQENMDYFRKEVFSNLENIPNDNKKHYLGRIRYEFEIKNKLSTISLDDIQIWLSLYHIKSEDEVRYNQKDNPISKFLASNTPTPTEESQKGFDKNTALIQEQFYYYYYGYYIKKAIAFIDEQIENLNPYTNFHAVDNNFAPETIPRQPNNPQLQLKTFFTVPELALLFKLFKDITPAVLNIKSNKELYEFIEASFLTVGKTGSGPTIAKLNNLNSDIDEDDVDFLIELFKKMLQMLRQMKIN